MVSNQILQNTIDGLKSITRIDLCLIDTDGKVVATTFPDTEECEKAVLSFITSPAESQVIQGYQFFKVNDDQHTELVLLARGTTDDVYMIGKMAAFQVQSLIVAYKERFDKDNFIETKNEKDTNALEIVRTLFAPKTHDFITAVDEKNIILVKEVKSTDTLDDLDKTAYMIIDMLSTEAMSAAKIAYGTVINDIREVSRSYKEAQMALDVGKIFYSDKSVVAYSRLGIGRLIYQLPIPLCQMFIREIFGGKSPDDFDEETLSTINKFFENSLNVSETSRQLYIHRNTLVYRLDKLQKSTGLDLRKFDDAITFKIALMVVKYMKYVENRDSF